MRCRHCQGILSAPQLLQLFICHTVSDRGGNKLVQKYMRLNGGGANSCGDYARVHVGGPSGLRKRELLDFGERVQQCYDVLSGEADLF